MTNYIILGASFGMLLLFLRGVRRHWSALFLLCVLTLQAHAEWVTPKGKTYHTRRECIALRTTAAPEEISRKQAEKRGLRVCGICNRNKKGTR